MMTGPDLLPGLQEALAGRFVVAHEIGRGGMAVVYLAHDVESGRSVAVKVLTPGPLAGSLQERFRQEVEIAKLLSHPRIVPILGAGHAGDLLYFVMPYVEGRSLRDRLLKGPELMPREILCVVEDLAEALAHAQAKGIVHRDIKPENILIAGGRAVILDFGIAQVCANCGLDRLTRPGQVMGTPRYMSPEQAWGGPDVDHRADIYGLGCIVYEMLVGEPPAGWQDSSGARTGRLRDLPARHRRAVSGLPPGVEGVLARALAMPVELRYESALDLFRDLARALGRKRRFDPGTLFGWLRRVTGAA